MQTQKQAGNVTEKKNIYIKRQNRNSKQNAGKGRQQKQESSHLKSHHMSYTRHLEGQSVLQIFYQTGTSFNMLVCVLEV